jgi:hypothetical protein
MDRGDISSTVLVAAELYIVKRPTSSRHVAKTVAMLALSMAQASCRPSASVPLPGDAANDGRDRGAAATDAPAVVDACASTSEYDRQIFVEADPMTTGFAPFDVGIFGGGLDVRLFSIDGSGEGADLVDCKAIDAGASHVRVECHDGSQSKSAEVRLSEDHLDLETEVDGARSRREVPVRPCARLVVQGLVYNRPESTTPPSHSCSDAGGGKVVDAFLRLGPASPSTHLASVFLDVPLLRIHRSIGETFPDSCESAITTRGWAFVGCGGGDDGFHAKGAATRSEIVFEHSSPLGGHARQQIPTPCDSRVVLHALPQRDAGLGTRP